MNHICILNYAIKCYNYTYKVIVTKIIAIKMMKITIKMMFLTIIIYHTIIVTNTTYFSLSVKLGLNKTHGLELVQIVDKNSVEPDLSE